MASTTLKFAIASLSLGSNLHHDLPTKIRVASKLGYAGIEIFMPDFEAFVEEVRQGSHRDLFDSTSDIASSPIDQLEYLCAEIIHTLCSTHDLRIPLIQPLRNFENFSTEQDLFSALRGAERWFRLMQPMHCDLVLVCSNYVPPPYPIMETYTLEMYLDAQVEAFRKLGELAERYGVKVGYEPLAWGTVVDNWEQIWEVVKRVNRPNVGVILDSFNILGNQYADPLEPSCIRRGQTLNDMLRSLEKMSRTIPGERIFFYQIADAIRPNEICGDSQEMPRRMKWSRACRVFPCESPVASSSTSIHDHTNPPSGYLGFLPVVQMTSLIHHTMEYRGWWSLEVFNTSLQDSDEGCTWRHGRRGVDGLLKLWEEVQLVKQTDDDLDVTCSVDVDEVVSEDSTPSTPQLSPSGSDIEEAEDSSKSSVSLAENNIEDWRFNSVKIVD
ncbi:4-hydroxyphenylpyruvate [Moniliophthora roreri]|uniref:Putative xylose isomerase-like protein n=1 Tax=Moniliophthora roreri TaxID=221103 RepID=A0A0W0EXY9_MONRR|nr:4-hydroxyphenylpyruvate [Moniliophthora roreri]